MRRRCLIWILTAAFPLAHAWNAPLTRRETLSTTARAFMGSAVTVSNALPEDSSVGILQKRRYNQQFPTLFAPLYGQGTRETILRSIGENIWAVEQNLELGPLQVPIRCVVIRLEDGTLFVHNPLAPTEEFFDLVESCATTARPSEEVRSRVAHVVVPTYALEHKVFAKDALDRWSNAKLWTSPGQFSFPIASVPDEFIWGRNVDGVLSNDLKNAASEDDLPSWMDEIDYDTLESGTFQIGLSPVTFYETTFFHKKSKSLIVTDALIRVPSTPPELNDPEKLLLISKRSTLDAQPLDTMEARTIGWEKTALLVSYFFPEHEEPDPNTLGVVTWTEGWHDNFEFLANRLLVPPVVRELLYAKNPAAVQAWVDRVCEKWEFDQVVPAHFEAPIAAKPSDVRQAFRFLKDDTVDAFLKNDLARGIRPIADLVLGRAR